MSAIEPRIGFTVCSPAETSDTSPSEEDAEWVRLDQLSPSLVSDWIDAKAGEVGGHRGIFTGGVAEALARRAVAPALACWALEGRVPELRPKNIHLRRTAEGMIDRTALQSTVFAVLESDPVARDPSAWPVGSQEELGEWFGLGLVQVLTPLFDTVRGGGRYGLRGLWGLAADAAASTLVRLNRLGQLDATSGACLWRQVDAGFTRAAQMGVPAKIRPTVRVEQREGAETLVHVRGVCCLYYATPAGADRPLPDRYCGTCPYRAAV